MKMLISVLILGMLLTGCAPQTPTATALPQPTAEPTATSVPVEVPWWKTAVFYEIFVRSFYDSDGDGIGDINGMTSKLDYLNDGNPETKHDLGITAIWLMPIHPSPSYHGYDVLNYYGVNPEYGSMEDFKRFLAAAHERGIRVIIDLVLNHTSVRHPFFASPSYRDWYIWSDTNSGAGWHDVSGSESSYYGYFCSCMPDLNYQNPDVTTQMNKVMAYWLESVGVDGFRVDAAKHLIEEDGGVNSQATHDWLKGYYTFYKSINQAAYSVGEVSASDARLVSTYTGDQFDQIFNFEMASGVVNSVKGEATSAIKSAVTFTMDDMPDWNFGTFLTNHDQDRVMSVLGGDVNKAKLAAFILLTSPGTPYIYYGEEIGMIGRKPDEFIRRPMQWSSEPGGGFSSSLAWEELDPGYVESNVENQQMDEQSLLATYRDLIAIRQANPVLAVGAYVPVTSSNTGVYSFIRADGLNKVLVVVNLTKNSVTDFSLKALNTAIPDAEYPVADLLTGEEGVPLLIQNGDFSDYQPVQILAPYEGRIFKIVE
ncbi:MAG TPA: alpha-amylase family glycosyl hydrolase [Bellilinea sp.]|nr:alpha-amylase family glycosyl hydrolase [Bellilinea sp.]